ncbi:MAG: dihydrolipoamide dehydrogenase [Rhodospirillales bacterium 20-60-12]|nr:MAG: dihydrolipoamide dehydrogenase [Rhodospirillales bacterium 20-60-12]HQT67530.1 FAD-dependent oxidoreductase [Acetobacteraceae bacterium]
MSGIKPRRFDLIVIGAGAAGLSAVYGAASLGLKVALIERGAMGGDCLNTGCVPSKSLLSIAHKARQSGQIPPWETIKAGFTRAIAEIAPNDSIARYTSLGATVITGEARFTGPDQIMVNGEYLTARRFVVATGSSPRIPAIMGVADLPFLTSDTIWQMGRLPDHLLILGGGPIGLEMADAFSGLGVAVTVIEARMMGAREDADLFAPVRAALEAAGVRLMDQTEIELARPWREGVELLTKAGQIIQGSHLLVAIGRAADFAALDLPRAGVLTSQAGIVTDQGLRSISNKRVYAAGDIADPKGIGPRHFTHVAGYHGGIVIRRALFRLPAKIDYAALPRVTYTAPELAQVGMTAAEAVAAGRFGRSLVWPFAENDRAIAEAETAGLVKLVLDPRGRLIGAGIVGPGAGEMIGLYGLAISAKLKLAAIAALILPYPTRSEAGKRAIGAFYAEKLFAPWPRRLVRLLARLP